MESEIKKNRNGHDIFVKGVWVMWVTGSARNANKELKLYLRNN